MRNRSRITSQSDQSDDQIFTPVVHTRYITKHHYTFIHYFILFYYYTFIPTYR